MTRRLQMAGVGLCAFLFPACTGNTQPTDPYYTGPGVVLMNRNPGGAAGRLQPQDHSGYNPTAVLPPADSNNGSIVPVKSVTTDPMAILPPKTNEITISQLPTKSPIRPIQVVMPPVDPIKLSPELSKPVQQAFLPIAPNPAGYTGTYPSGNALVAPKWPNLGGAVVEPNGIQPPEPLPKIDALAVPSPSPTPTPTPTLTMPNLTTPLLPPLSAVPLDPVQPVVGVSMKVQESVVLQPATPTPAVAPMSAVPARSNDDTHLIMAIRAFQNNRPDEALERLKQLDPTNQELLMYLMPLMVRLGEGKVNSVQPDEMAMLIDRLQAASSMLKSKATLGADHVCFCRGVRKFADVDPYEPRHEFRPGDMVFLYAELKNFTCEPVNAAQQRQGNIIAAQRGFSIRLATTLELRDARNALIWRTDLTKNDFAQSPPQDYYHTYRFCVPEKLPAGVYTLWLNVTDKPSGRAIRKPIEMRVGQS